MEVDALLLAVSQPDATSGASSGGAAGLVAAQCRQSAEFTVPAVIAQLMGRMSHLSLALAARSPVACVCAEVDHISQKGGEGSWWSCGYRNAQMLCSALLRDATYGGMLFGGSRVVPDLLSLQCWVQRAWDLGYDPDGAAQLGGHLVGCEKWIGSTETVALLRSFGIPARVIAFHSFDSPMVEQALGAGAAARARACRIAAERGLFAATGTTPDHHLRPWAYDATGKPKSTRGRGRGRGAAGAGRGGSMAAAGGGSSAGTGASATAVAAAAAASSSGGGGGGDLREWMRRTAQQGCALDYVGDDDVEIIADTSASAAVSAIPVFGAFAAPSTSDSRSSGPVACRGSPQYDAAVRLYLFRRNEGLLRFLSRHFRAPLHPRSPRQPQVPLGGGSSGASTYVGAGDKGCGSVAAAPLQATTVLNAAELLRPFPMCFQHDGHSRTLIGFETRMPMPSRGGGAGSAAAPSAASAKRARFFCPSDGRNGAGKPAAGEAAMAAKDYGDGDDDDFVGTADLFEHAEAGAAIPAPPDEGAESSVMILEDGAGCAAGSVAPAAVTSSTDATSGGVIAIDDGEAGEETEGERAHAGAAGAATTTADEAGGCEVQLLVLDPSTSSAGMRDALAAGGRWEQTIKRGLATLRQPIYELVIVDRVTRKEEIRDADLAREVVEEHVL